MRAFHATVLGLVAAAALGAADPPFTLPAPPVVPAPRPAPGAVPTLTPDALYVIDARVEAVVRAHPAGLVRVVAEKGPIRIRGRFVDGVQVETRTFAGPYVYLVEPVGTGRVELDLIPLGLKSEADIVTAVIDVDAGQGPIPPPKPKPDPEPKPDPAKVESAFVIVVEDAAAPRTLETAKALNDPFWAGLKPKHDFRHYLNTAKVAVDNGYVETAKAVGFPAVLVLDAKDGAVLKKFKLNGIDGVKSAVKEVTK